MREIKLYFDQYLNIELAWYSNIVLIVGLLSIVLGSYVLYRERASRLGISYFFFSASLSLYLICAALIYGSRVETAALAWSHLAHLGVVFIPFSVLWTSSILIGDTRNLRRWRNALLGVSLLFAFTVLFTDSFIAGVQRLSWTYYVYYGSMGYLFIIYAVLVMASVITLYLLEARVETDPLRRKRLSLTILAICLGLFGCVDFLPAVGAVSVYSFGALPILFFVILMGYTTLRFRLVDITPELAAVPVLQTMRGSVIVTDRAGIIRLANNSAHRMIGLLSPSLLNERAAPAVPWIKAMKNCEECPVGGGGEEVEWRDADGASHTVLVKVSVLRDAARNLIGWVYVAHDITDRKRAEYALQQTALHDSLTELPNRKYFLDHLSRMIELSRRGENGFAILYMDLNKFKEINDRKGHDAGDRVLRACAQRIRAAVRRSDTVARIGGDEFIVLCTYLNSKDDAVTIAGKISDYLKDPVLYNGDQLHTGVAIGIARFPEDGSDAGTLISAADKAMYRAKSGNLDWAFHEG